MMQYLEVSQMIVLFIFKAVALRKHYEMLLDDI